MRHPIALFNLWIAIHVGVALCFALGPARAATPPAAVEQVTVTTDSTPGWLPTVEQKQQVKAVAFDYLAAKDSGQSQPAYGFLADELRKQEPFAAYAVELADFNRAAGKVRSRRIVQISWTKDPAQAPAPGVYAALDLISSFENVDRHCGFLILYQRPAGGPFKVMREEANFIRNEDFASIARTKSKEAAEQAWTSTASNCPNYLAAAAKAEALLPEQADADLGFPTVAAALTALRSRTGVVVSDQHGWTVIDDRPNRTIWTFPPSDNPAYPAVVKREIVESAGGSSIRMAVLCEASKVACDNLVRQFQALNAQVAIQPPRRR